MWGFDTTILMFLNGFVGQSPSFDAAVLAVSHLTLLKGGLILAFFWWLWVSMAGELWEQRGRLLTGLCGGLASIIVSRIFAATLPFRVRPMLNPDLHLKLVGDLHREQLLGWSSFPSDHSALFFALAAALWHASRAFGILALVHAIVVISLPRLYLGIHYPTDVLGGAAIGCIVALAFQAPWLRSRMRMIGLSWERAHAPSFYAVMFLLTFEIALLFDDIRHIAVRTWHLLNRGL